MEIFEKAKIIKNAFDSYLILPIEEWIPLAELMDLRTVKKEVTIKTSGKVENNFNLIISGSLCILHWNTNNFICTDLFFEDEFAFDHLSFITHQSTPYEVRAMEDTILLTGTYSGLKKFLNQTKYSENIQHFGIQFLYVDKHYKQFQLLTKTPTQRYLTMLKQQGKMLLRVPHKYIASYIGITQQSLSRIRRKVSHPPH